MKDMICSPVSSTSLPPLSSPPTRTTPVGSSESAQGAASSSSLFDRRRRRRPDGRYFPVLTRATSEPLPSPPSSKTCIVCHICGQLYTMNSIHIHLSHCEFLWEKRQQALPIHLRKPIPTMLAVLDQIQTMTVEEHNQLALQVYQQHASKPCTCCQESILPHEWQSHVLQCAKKQSKQQPVPALLQQQQNTNTSASNNNRTTNTSASQITTPNPARTTTINNSTSTSTNTEDNDDNVFDMLHKPVHAPNTVICHICGRKYTIHSIDIHLPQCQKLWNQRQAQLPIQQQKPVPTIDGMETLTLQQRNDLAMEVYNEVALEACPHCDRTFLPDRLKVHLRSCQKHAQEQLELSKKQQQHKKTRQKQQQQQQQIDQLPIFQPPLRRFDLEPCVHCGRTFFFDRLEVHLRSCSKKEEQPVTTSPQHQSPMSSQLPEQEQEIAILLQQNRRRISNPTMEACIHCERTFFPDRLQVHLKSCGRPTTSSTNSSLSPSKSKSSLQRSLELSHEEQEMYKKTNPNSNLADTLEPCIHCGRKFFPDRLQVHLRSCGNSSSSHSRSIKQQQQRDDKEVDLSLSSPTKRKNKQNRISNPSMESCIHCGRTFFPDRLQVHLKSCSKQTFVKIPNRSHPKHDDDEISSISLLSGGRKNKKKVRIVQSKRLQYPFQNYSNTTTPSSFSSRDARSFQVDDDEISSMSSYSLPEKRRFNSNKQLQPCTICGRTFFPDRLQVHLKSCKKKKDKDRDTSTTSGTSSSSCGKKKKPCIYCGRSFRQDKFQDHLQSCRPKNRQQDDDDDNSIGSQSYSSIHNQKSPNLTRGFKTCRKCGRSIDSDRLQVHIKTCCSTAASKKKKTKKKKKKDDTSMHSTRSCPAVSTTATTTTTTHPCIHCGRSFFLDLLPDHVRSCQQQHCVSSFLRQRLVQQAN